MTLRQKTTCAVVTTFLCLFTALYLVSQGTIRSHYRQAELLTARENVQRVQDTLQQRLKRQTSNVQSWAQWDESYLFVQGKFKNYAEKYLSSANISTMESNFVAIVRRDGKLIFATGFDLQKKIRTPVPLGVNQLLRSENPLLHVSAPEEKRVGFIADGRALMLASWPITQSDGSGPPLGVYILGRYLDEQEIKQISNVVHLPVRVQPWNSKALPDDFQVAKEQLKKPAPYAQVLNETTVAGYSVLKDVFDRPSLILRAEARRDLYLQGEAGLRNLKISLALMGVVFSVLALLLLDITVLRRLSALTSELDDIGTQANMSGRVKVRGGDELARLAAQVNSTLGALEETQRQLIVRERQYTSITDNVPGLVYQIVQQTDGQLSVPFVNQGSLRIFGIEPEFFQKEINQVISWIVPEDGPSFFSSWQHSTETMTDWAWEGRFILPGGDMRWVQAASRPTAMENGVIAWDGLLTDVTARKNAEAALQKAHDELEQRVTLRTAELSQTNTKLQGEIIERQMVMATLRETVTQLEEARSEAENANRAKSDFLSRMSHELRTPLNAIIGFAQLLENDVESPDERESIEHILNAGRHLLGLINEVLDITSIEAGRMSVSLEPLPVTEIIEETVALVRPLAEAHKVSLLPLECVQNENSMRLDDSGNCYVYGDRQRLKQVLLNLLSNAVKYNRAGGEVRIGFGVQNNRVRIQVQDTGTGIPSDKVARLFTPFDRLDAEQIGIEGTGIGLFLTKRLVSLMEGTLGFDSAPGQGSTFWVELPLAESPANRQENPAPLGQVLVAATTRTILYIEDNLPNLRLIERTVQRSPELKLLTATLGAQGLEMARQQQPDLILLDVHLPDFNGDHILASLKADAATSHIPVVMVSADATAEQIAKLRAAGAVDYLTKPLELSQFLRVVQSLLFQE